MRLISVVTYLATADGAGMGGLTIHAVSLTNIGAVCTLMSLAALLLGNRGHGKAFLQKFHADHE